MVSFIFGGNTGIRSPEDLLQRRRAQEALMRSSVNEPPRTLGEGIAAIARAISGRWGYDALAKEEARSRDAAGARFDALFAALDAGAPHRAGSRDLSAFVQAYSDPWMSPERRSVLQLHIDREMQAADRLRREQLEKNKRGVDAAEPEYASQGDGTGIGGDGRAAAPPASASFPRTPVIRQDIHDYHQQAISPKPGLRRVKPLKPAVS